MLEQPVLRTQSEKPFIEIEGVKHYECVRTVKLCKLLMDSEGERVKIPFLMDELGTQSNNTFSQYVYRLREIVEPRGWRVLLKSFPSRTLQLIRNPVTETI